MNSPNIIAQMISSLTHKIVTKPEKPTLSISLTIWVQTASDGFKMQLI